MSFVGSLLSSPVETTVTAKLGPSTQRWVMKPSI